MKAVPFSAWCEFILLGIIVVAYLLVATQHLDLPGPDDNEMWAPAHARAFIRGELQPGILEFRKQYLPLWGHPLAMILGGPTPHGPLKVYPLIPMIALFGANIKTYRLTTIAIGAIILVGVYLLALTLTRRRVGALAATLLLATDPTFVFFMRADPSQVTPIMVSLVFGVFLLGGWRETRAIWQMALGAFFLGLGLWSRLHFIWFLSAAGCALLVFYRDQLRQLVQQQRRPVAVGIISLLAGCSVLIVFFIATRAAPMRELATVFEHTDTGVDNRKIVQNLAYQTAHFFDLLNGTRLLKLYSSLPDSPGYAAHIDPIGSILPFLFVASVLGELHLGWKKETRAHWRLALWLCLIIALIVSQSILTVSAFHSYNMVLIWPLPHLVIALAMTDAMTVLPGKFNKLNARGVAWACATLLILAAVISLNTIQNYFHELQTLPSSALWSPATFSLVEYLDQRETGSQLNMMDWGIGKNVYALSRFPAPTVDLWTKTLYPTQYNPAWDTLFNVTEARYIFRAEALTLLKAWTGNDDPRTVFQMVAQKNRLAPCLEKIIYGGDGRPVYEIYTLNSTTLTPTFNR